MANNETIADIIAEKRLRAREMEIALGDQHSFVESLKNDADRLDAARKREIDVLKQRCAELNAEVAAKDEVIKRLNDAISEEQRRKMATAEKSSVAGDCAKLRDAAKDVARQLRAWAAQIDPFSKDGTAPQRLRALAAILEGGTK